MASLSDDRSAHPVFAIIESLQRVAATAQAVRVGHKASLETALDVSEKLLESLRRRLAVDNPEQRLLRAGADQASHRGILND